MTDEQLFELIKNVRQQPEGSRQYQRSIKKLLQECQELPGLLKSTHPNYLDALNETWEWVWRNIKSFELSLSSVRQSLVAWINGYLYWRIRDLYIGSYANFLSLEELLQKNEEELVLVAQLLGSSWNTASYSPLENYIKQSEIEETRRIGLALKETIKADLQDRLKSIYFKERADCNCKFMSQRLLLKDPPDTLVSLSRELQINSKTLSSHWKKKCRPCLQRMAIELNYQPR